MNHHWLPAKCCWQHWLFLSCQKPLNPDAPSYRICFLKIYFSAALASHKPFNTNKADIFSTKACCCLSFWFFLACSVPYLWQSACYRLAQALPSESGQLLRSARDRIARKKIMRQPLLDILGCQEPRLMKFIIGKSIQTTIPSLLGAFLTLVRYRKKSTIKVWHGPFHEYASDSLYLGITFRTILETICL